MDKINIEEFGRIEIRIGTVISAEKAEGTDKLLKIVFDFGSAKQNSEEKENKESPSTHDVPGNNLAGRETRQIMSAIAEFYPDPKDLVGKQIAVCTNLEPKTFRGYESQGMIMATGDKDTGIVLMVPEKPVEPGARIH